MGGRTRRRSKTSRPPALLPEPFVERNRGGAGHCHQHREIPAARGIGFPARQGRRTKFIRYEEDAMNDIQIETLLRKAPQPAPPPDLLERLQSDISLSPAV